MFNLIKSQWIGIVALVFVAFVLLAPKGVVEVAPLAGIFDGTNFTNPVTFKGGLTDGGGCTTLTDANGGTYTLTEAEMLSASCFEFAAGGAGQATIALTFPATSTMTTLLKNAGDCRTWSYDATALSAATTTTMTAGTGINVIAYTTADDVIDGAEYAEIKMCRQSNRNVNLFTTEMLNAD